MEKTSVMAKFLILGDWFPVLEVTNRLLIQPTETYNKGDVSKYNNLKKETCWSISTGYEESEDINEQLSQIVNLISYRVNILHELKKEFLLKFSFMIVCHIYGNDKPAIYLERETIHFASKIDAPIHFDYYIYPEDK